MKAWVTQLRKGVTELVVLRMLAQEEMYGYRLVQRLKALDGLEITESTVYPVLNRLVEDGSLQGREVRSSTGPPRRYFSVTTTGRQRLGEMMACWQGLCKAIDDLQDSTAAGEHA